MKIPFVDLKAQYKSIKNEIDNSIERVIKDTAFIKGKYVDSFERKYSEMYNIKHCIGVGNGTDALYILQKSLGIGKGDEVVTVSNSWISTSETISQTGAKPVFVDIEEDFYNIKVDEISDKINSNTKAIIPVHIYGQPADMKPIVDICEDYKLNLIEDCAQSHFASYRGREVGTFGDAGTFSFFPGKNLGAYGDAGAIITNDDNLASNARKFANHGSLVKHKHEIEGINSRLDGIQASILETKLDYILEWNDKRRHNADLYSNLLSDVSEIVLPKIRRACTHVFHVYCIRAKRRDALKLFLETKGISCQIHYPKALPFLEAYSSYGYEQSEFPISYSYMDEILSLPMFPELEEKQIEYIVNSIREFYGR